MYRVLRDQSLRMPDAGFARVLQSANSSIPNHHASANGKMACAVRVVLFAHTKILQLDRDMVSVVWVLDNAECRRHRTQSFRPWTRAQKGLFAAYHLSDMWGSVSSWIKLHRFSRRSRDGAYLPRSPGPNPPKVDHPHFPPSRHRRPR